MAFKGLFLNELLIGIKNFNEKLYGGSYLCYCIDKDALHPYNGIKCTRMVGCNPEKSISIYEYPEVLNFEELKKYFGKDFYPKILEKINSWPIENPTFLKDYDYKNKFREREELLNLYEEWGNLDYGEKLNQVFDLDILQESVNYRLKKIWDVLRAENY